MRRIDSAITSNVGISGETDVIVNREGVSEETFQSLVSEGILDRSVRTAVEAFGYLASVYLMTITESDGSVRISVKELQ